MIRLFLFIVFTCFLSCKKESDEKLLPTNTIFPKELALISPVNNSTIFKDKDSNIVLKWTQQPNAFIYEIFADYTPSFQLINKGFINNEQSISKRIIVNSLDTIAFIPKHKIDWNTSMYLKIRVIYTNNDTSEWSEVISIHISDPRPKYLGNYTMDINYRSIIAGVDTTNYFFKIPCEIQNIDKCGLLIKNSVFEGKYNPYVFNYVPYNYGMDKFYSTAFNGLPSGAVNFMTSVNMDSTYIKGTFSVNYLSGGVTYNFSGYKIN